MTSATLAREAGVSLPSACSYLAGRYDKMSRADRAKCDAVNQSPAALLYLAFRRGEILTVRDAWIKYGTSELRHYVPLIANRVRTETGIHDAIVSEWVRRGGLRFKEYRISQSAVLGYARNNLKTP